MSEAGVSNNQITETPNNVTNNTSSETPKTTQETSKKNNSLGSNMLAILGVALAGIGFIIGLIVWLKRTAKKKKEEDERNLEVSKTVFVGSGNSGISKDNQKQMNEQFNAYSNQPVNRNQSQINLDSINKTKSRGIR